VLASSLLLILTADSHAVGGPPGTFWLSEDVLKPKREPVSRWPAGLDEYVEEFSECREILRYSQDPTVSGKYPLDNTHHHVDGHRVLLVVAGLATAHEDVPCSEQRYFWPLIEYMRENLDQVVSDPRYRHGSELHDHLVGLLDEPDLRRCRRGRLGTAPPGVEGAGRVIQLCGDGVEQLDTGPDLDLFILCGMQSLGL
jgi:hypothetical protein